MAVINLTADDVARKLAEGSIVLIDVREPHEYNIVNLGHIMDFGMPLIPVGDIECRASELAHRKNSEIVIYCKAGVRSQKAALALKHAGFTNVSNLAGGILAWADKIDRSMPKY